jgi:hypothetical protein
MGTHLHIVRESDLNLPRACTEARVEIGRRRALGALAAVALVAMGFPAAAQDAKSGAVQKAARDWLALTDQGDGKASWNAAGPSFRNATPVEGWGSALKQVRDPLGPVGGRAVESTRFANSIPSFPPGEYAIVVFRTSFAKRPTGHETVTLQSEGNGVWRVVGYLIG